LALSGNRRRALCEPWSLALSGTRRAAVSFSRALLYVRGHEALEFPNFFRPRYATTCCGALSFEPAALVAIGDQFYWDLLAPQNSRNV